MIFDSLLFFFLEYIDLAFYYINLNNLKLVIYAGSILDLGINHLPLEVRSRVSHRAGAHHIP